MAIEQMATAVHYQQFDPGLVWIKDSGIAIDSSGPLDADRTLTPNVLRVDGGYRMYYHGCGPERPQLASKGYILSAFSTDAAHWQKEPGVRLGDGQTSYGAPRCLYLDGGGPRYRLYASASPFPDGAPYAGAYNDHHIVSAVSDDGLHFELEDGVRVAQDRDLEAFSVYAPEVLRLAAGGYRMYYAGWLAAPEVAAGSKYHGRIFSAFSDDGVDWRKDPDICIDNGGRWDAVKASEPCVIDLPDGRYRMFYEACDETGCWRIASATSGAT
tara:strand:+ start:26 stop:835 length:810 start_codon:yes stop_codon:yes gene_type:complete